MERYSFNANNDCPRLVIARGPACGITPFEKLVRGQKLRVMYFCQQNTAIFDKVFTGLVIAIFLLILCRDKYRHGMMGQAAEQHYSIMRALSGRGSFRGRP